MLPSTPEYSKWSLSLGVSHQNPVRTSTLTMRATWPAHLILLDLITQIIFGEEQRSLSLLHYLVTSSLLDPNIFLSTLFSSTLSLYSSLKMNDQVSHPYKTTGDIVVL